MDLSHYCIGSCQRRDDMRKVVRIRRHCSIGHWEGGRDNECQDANKDMDGEGEMYNDR